jgi:hypothetical protein
MYLDAVRHFLYAVRDRMRLPELKANIYLVKRELNSDNAYYR